ncbi:B3 domain-containing protein At4g01580-like [Castanea sativa]|uniref:B3 domain-containing protein At4g01580-like n=1 Tax=Castanea sativa TaxID=21020 RepID=UPI003F6494D8
MLDFGDELSTSATLIVPNGGTWKVGLLKAEWSIWFCECWEDFVEFYSIFVEHLLVFRYERNSNFHVIIFDTTATETQYPSNNNVNLEDTVDLTELDEINISRQYKQPFDTSSKGRDRAIGATKIFMPKGRSFMAVMQSYNIWLNYVYVPKEFADKHIAWNQFVDLQTCGEKQWRVRCYCHTATSSAMRIGKGWAAFSTKNI